MPINRFGLWCIYRSYLVLRCCCCFRQLYAGFCVVFLFTRGVFIVSRLIGTGFGFLMALMPHEIGNAVRAVALVAVLLLLLLLALFAYLQKTSRGKNDEWEQFIVDSPTLVDTEGEEKPAAGESGVNDSPAHDPFALSCQRVSRDYGLTKRQAEVLPLSSAWALCEIYRRQLNGFREHGALPYTRHRGKYRAPLERENHRFDFLSKYLKARLIAVFFLQAHCFL